MSPQVCQHGSVPCNSWIVVRRATGEAIFETWSDTVAAKIRADHYEALRPCVYLPRLNLRGPQ